MEQTTDKKKLRLIDEALNYFYNMDSDTLIANYQQVLQDKKEEKAGITVTVMDKETAIGILNEIPEKCYQGQSLKIEDSMVKAVSESELLNLCEEQVKFHPDIEMEIRSMFKFCINIKRQIENNNK